MIRAPGFARRARAGYDIEPHGAAQAPVFQCGFFPLEAPAFFEDPPDHHSVLEQIMKDNKGAGGFRGQDGAGLLPGENIQRAHNGYKHESDDFNDAAHPAWLCCWDCRVTIPRRWPWKGLRNTG